MRHPPYPDLLAVATRVPRGIMCCLSAAALFDLADEMMNTVQIAVPRPGYVPRIDYPPTEIFRFDAGRFDLGTTSVEAAPGEVVPVYDAARTVVDLMRLRHHFGEPAAHTALNRYLALPGARPGLVMQHATTLGVAGPMRSALDVATTR